METPFPVSADAPSYEAPYASFQQPVDPTAQAMMQPATTAAELETRKQGWTQVYDKIKSDPNLMRSIGMFGTQLMQPVPFGQTPMGHLGGAINVGTSAYQFGQEAEFQRQRQQTADVRAQQAHESQLAYQGAQTEQARTTTESERMRHPAIQAASTVAAATVESKIKEAGLSVQKLEAELAAAGTAQERNQILLRKEQEIDKIWRGLPEGAKTEAIRADLMKPVTEMKLREAQAVQARAAAGASSAHARLFGAQAGQEEIENRALQDIYKEKGAAGVFAARQSSRGAQSAQVQYLQQVEGLFKRANPEINDRELAQQVIDYHSEKKTSDRELYLKWAESNRPKKGETPEAHYQRFEQSGAGRRTQGPPLPGALQPPAASAGAQGPNLISTEDEYNALPVGAFYRRPTDPPGTMRRKTP